MAREPSFQSTEDVIHDRTDHVWFRHAAGWKCCLCGGLARVPPAYPTPRDWTPEKFELPLTEEERRLCPNPKAGAA